jgi:hypothetical protein
MTVNYSTSISLSVGAGGIGPTTGYSSMYYGGDGAGGYAGITWDNNSSARTSGSASYTIN